MTRGLWILFAIAMSGISMSKDVTLSEVRKLYAEAKDNESSCTKLIDTVKKSVSKTQVLLGYKACATMIMANHTINPISKLQYFSDGKKELETLIKANSGNHELRYLRLTIQTNAPSFLGYSGEVENDKKFLKASLSKLPDTELKKIISDYLAILK